MNFVKLKASGGDSRYYVNQKHITRFVQYQKGQAVVVHTLDGEHFSVDASEYDTLVAIANGTLEE